jgi:NADPH:quinone reductase-like Zn-dependent oxidoreductase
MEFDDEGHGFTYKNGGPEAFQGADVDVPVCGPDQVLIKTSISQSRAAT